MRRRRTKVDKHTAAKELSAKIEHSWRWLNNTIAQRPVDIQAICLACDHALLLDREKSKMEYDAWWTEHDKNLLYGITLPEEAS
jgi:hypothetical protein